jgi:hypothetical protein
MRYGTIEEMDAAGNLTTVYDASNGVNAPRVACQKKEKRFFWWGIL